ncbi:MAG: hypothetical protein ACOCP8_05440, partial [archaeon]
KKVSPDQYVLVCFPDTSSDGRQVIRVRMRVPPKLRKDINEGNKPGIPELINELNEREKWGIYGGGHPAAGGATIFNTYVSPSDIQWEFEFAYRNVKTGKMSEKEKENIIEKLGGALNVPAYYYILKVYSQYKKPAKNLIKKAVKTENKSYYLYGQKLPQEIGTVMAKEKAEGKKPLPLNPKKINPYHYLHKMVELGLLKEVDVETDSGREWTFYVITNKGIQLYSKISETRTRVDWSGNGNSSNQYV